MKYLTGILLIVLFGMTVYWAINLPVMIPTLIIGWVILWLQAKFNCFN